MAYLLLYIALTWLVLMPARFRAMAKGYRKASLVLKALPTALAAAFAAAGYFSAEVRDLYGLMIFIGLCVCTLADVALDVRFEVGGALFFTGHVVYVAALSQYRVLSWWCLTAVSYTHLDVYKRQASQRPAPCTPSPCPRRP